MATYRTLVIDVLSSAVLDLVVVDDSNAPCHYL